ncbi:DNA polymerase beta domain protein region [Sulfolobus islandicus L.S.2.15]|uniref:DNA polymerase beta domain protein region n=2 Tax=Saccharolobus islandicus TaxID=43080 RepID=C3MN47_SACI2|nr:nucleotidyltransferase domain-containing protein [Sulfolobus islandicus]ACP34887.1 DNA polymerase beta domain protein region [Sulfolobus islandicus L.S.2.15]ADB86553.1 DNA polymerase, beta domain protein region [Sulfolobus islandicus L.D.8.5]
MQEPYKSLLEKLTKLLQEEFQDKLISVVLYGSVARGDNRKDSDIDLLLVIKDLPKTITERIILFDKVERKLDDDIMRLMDEGYYVTFSPILKTPEEAMRFSPIYMDMTEDAIILYDRNGFFRKVLEKTKKRLKELGFERVWLSKKSWYWRKRDYKFGEIIDFGDVLE